MGRINVTSSIFAGALVPNIVIQLLKTEDLYDGVLRVRVRPNGIWTVESLN